MTNNIQQSLFLEDYYRANTNKTGSTVMGKDDFLKLLIVQLQNQDPLNPMEDREFIAQMANFSSLEQMTNMNQMMEKMVNATISQSLVQHSELIGKKVTWVEYVENEHRVDEVFRDNTVKSVKIGRSGDISIELNTGMWITNHQLVQVKAPE